MLGSEDLASTQRIAIPLADGKQLVAESGHDRNYPREIYVSQRCADGTEQNIAYIGQKYTIDSYPVEYQDNTYEVLTVNPYGDFDKPQKDVEIPDI